MPSFTPSLFFERYHQKGKELLKEVGKLDDSDEIASEILGSLISLGFEANKYEETYNLTRTFKGKELKLRYDIWATTAVIEATLYANYFNLEYREAAIND